MSKIFSLDSSDIMYKVEKIFFSGEKMSNV